MDESPSVCPWQRSWTIFRRWYRALILDDFLSITSTSPLAFCHRRTLVAYPDVKSYVETYVEIYPFTSSLQLQWSLATFQWPMVNFKYPPFREVTLEVMKMAHNLSDGAFCGRTAQLHTTCPGSPATITMMAELIMVWVLVLGPKFHKSDETVAHGRPYRYVLLCFSNLTPSSKNGDWSLKLFFLIEVMYCYHTFPRFWQEMSENDPFSRKWPLFPESWLHFWQW